MIQKKYFNRRTILRSTAAAALAFPMVNMGVYKVFAASEQTYSSKAIDLVNSTQIFDMLSIISPMGPMIDGGFW